MRAAASKTIVNALRRLVLRQDGLITREQALGLHLHPSGIDRRVRSGEWIRLHNGVYLVAGHPVTAAVRLRAAVLAAGRDAAACGPSAAWWHGVLESTPSAQWITVPRARRPSPRPGVHVRRRDLHRDDVRWVRGLRVTATDLTVLETAVALDQQGTAFLDRAMQTCTTLTRLHRAHERNRGRTGSGAAARMLRYAGEDGESHAEKVFAALLRADRITGWRCGVETCGYLLDFGFERERVAIEIDGWAYHRTSERMAADAKRQNALINAGWLVLRFTYHRLLAEPRAVLAEVRLALARRA